MSFPIWSVPNQAGIAFRLFHRFNRFPAFTQVLLHEVSDSCCAELAMAYPIENIELKRY